MDEPTTESDDHGLAAALAAHPDARVTGVLESAKFCPLPDGLRGTHKVLEGKSTFDLFPHSEWPAIIDGWKRVQQYGFHQAVLTDKDGVSWSMSTFDVRDQFDMYVRMLVPVDAQVSDDAPDDTRPVVSRFGAYQRDALSTIIGMDDNARALLGWTLEQLGEMEGRDLIHPDDLANAEANWLAALVDPGKAHRWRGRHLDRGGDWRWIEFTNTSLLEEPEGYVLSEMMDISEEMATADALRERDELLARLNDALPLGVAHIDRDRRIVYANNRLAAVVGRERQETFAEQFASVVRTDRVALDEAIDRTLSDGADNDLDVHFSGLDGSGTAEDAERVCAISVRALHKAGRISGAVLCVSDITEATTMRRELERQATFDRLTGCLNPAATHSAIDRVLQERDTTAEGTALLFIDLDRFKPINDEFGHAAGDEVLKAVADRLREMTRSHDLVGRVGGDEFVVVCPGTSEATATLIAERIGAGLAEPLTAVGTTVQIGASVGVSWSSDDGITAAALVSTADAAMYERKRSGRSPEAASR